MEWTRVCAIEAPAQAAKVKQRLGSAADFIANIEGPGAAIV